MMTEWCSVETCLDLNRLFFLLFFISNFESALFEKLIQHQPNQTDQPLVYYRGYYTNQYPLPKSIENWQKISKDKSRVATVFLEKILVHFSAFCLDQRQIISTYQYMSLDKTMVWRQKVMLAKFYLKKRCKKVSCLINPHISSPSL